MASPLQAGQLADAALLELRQIQDPAAASTAAALPDEAVPEDGYMPALVAGVDALLRGCLKGQPPPPGAVLTVSRALLQLQAQWVQEGYRSSGAGSPAKANAVLLLYNSLLAALAGWLQLCWMKAVLSSTLGSEDCYLILDCNPGLEHLCCIQDSVSPANWS